MSSPALHSTQAGSSTASAVTATTAAATVAAAASGHPDGLPGGGYAAVQMPTRPYPALSVPLPLTHPRLTSLVPVTLLLRVQAVLRDGDDGGAAAVAALPR